MAKTDPRDIERLIMLVDAALAITLMLLMLDIRLPTTAEGMDDGMLAHALFAIAPRCFAYDLSFVVIGRFMNTTAGPGIGAALLKRRRPENSFDILHFGS